MKMMLCFAFVMLAVISPVWAQNECMVSEMPGLKEAYEKCMGPSADGNYQLDSANEKDVNCITFTLGYTDADGIVNDQNALLEKMKPSLEAGFVPAVQEVLATCYTGRMKYTKLSECLSPKLAEKCTAYKNGRK